MDYGTSFSCFHHHLMYMTERFMSKAERRIFNTLPSTAAIIDYLRDNYDVNYDQGWRYDYGQRHYPLTDAKGRTTYLWHTAKHCSHLWLPTGQLRQKLWSGLLYDFDVNTIMDDDLENTKDRPLHKPSQDQRKSTALGRAWNFVERCIMYSSEKHYYK